MKILLSCLFPALLVAACHTGTPHLRKLPPDAVILAFGDSLTYGTGALPDQSYPAVLQNLVSRKVVNAGIPGETTAEGLARLPAQLDRYRPSLILLCLGANDMLRGLSEKDAENNLRDMVRKAQQRNIQVVLIGVPRPNLFASPPDFYAEIASDYSLPYLKSALGNVLTKNALRADFIHPNAQGYRKFAEEVASFLTNCGAI